MRVDFKDFLRTLDTSKASFYFLTGPEEYPKIRARDRLLKSARFQGSTRALFAAQELKPPELMEKLTQPQLFGGEEVLVIQSAERLPAATKKALIEALENSSEGIPPLVCIAGNDRVDAADPLEGYAMAAKNAAHVFFPALTDSEVAGWGRSEIKRRGWSTPDNIIDRMGAVFGSDLYNWANFFRSLDAYVGTRKEITEEDLKIVLASGAPQEQGSWFDFENALHSMIGSSKRDEASLAASLAALDHLMDTASESEEAVVIDVLRLIGERTYEIASVKSGVSPSRRFPYAQHNGLIKQAANRWSWEQVEKAYDAVIEAEKNIKTGIMESRPSVRDCLSKFWELSAN